MSNRIIQLHTESRHREDLESLASEHEAIACWASETAHDNLHFHILLEEYQTQDMLDQVQKYFGQNTDYHLLILPVEAYMPRDKKKQDSSKDSEKEKERRRAKANIVREELEEEMRKNAAFDRNYVLMVVFATMVAAIGMLENNVAVLVGAMVIAPFLGPNLALTFASAMGQKDLIFKALHTLGLGSLIAFGCGVLSGQFWPIEEVPYELQMRAQVDYSSIVLALAAGAAAVLSISRGISSALVGVMVAAALLPPLAASGVFLGHGQISNALSALMLLAINVVCINLAGLGVFITRGVGPRTWYERREAKKSVYLFAAIWAGGLLALLAVIVTLDVLN
jgi:uncharacterized hydrophobic protein (TIGR00341 family)